MKKILSLLVIILLIMTSCTTGYDIDNTQKITLSDLKLEIEYDKFDKTTTLKTPIFGRASTIYPETTKYFIRAMIKNNKLLGLQIFGIFEAYNGGFSGRVTDEKGKNLKTTIIPITINIEPLHEVITEQVIIDIDTAYLKNISKTGIKIKFYGKKENNTIYLRKEAAQLILSELEKRKIAF